MFQEHAAEVKAQRKRENDEKQAAEAVLQVLKYLHELFS